MASQTGIDKAALLLGSLPAEVREGLLERLGPERAARVRARMDALEESPELAEMRAGVIQEVESLLQIPAAPASASAQQLAVYRQAAEMAAPQEPDPGEAPEALAGLAPEALAAVLHGEQAHTAALVLNALPPEMAGEVLQQLPPEMRREVPVCLTRLTSPNPELLARITRALLLKARSAGSDGPPSANARYEKIANMLRALEKAERMEAIAALQDQEPEAAARVKELLYQFEDLLRIHDRSMQKLLSEIDSKSLALALKGTSEAITQKVLNNLSMRARDALQEEMEFLGMVPIAQVRQGQKTVVDVIQRLDQAGELQMEEE